jgi:hypothetical protein
MVNKMFEALIKKVEIKLHNFFFELARANDPYRLRYLLCEYVAELDKLEKEADEMVRELEGA